MKRFLVPTMMPVMLGMALSGCASFSIATGEASAIADSSLPPVPERWVMAQESVGAVHVGWIDAFNDPVLSELVAEAQSKNRSLQATAAAVARAYALLRQSQSQLYPTLDGTAGAARSGPLEGGPTGNAFSLGVQSSWEVDVWGRVRSDVEAARQSARALEADYRFAQHSLAAAVARTYFIAIEARMQIGVAQDIVDALTEIDRIVQVRFENGYANAQDAALARTDLESARDSLLSAQLGERDAIRALEVLLGQYPDTNLEFPNRLMREPPPPPAGLPSQLLERRPDIIAAERRIAAAIAGVDQAQAARLPQISLTGSLGGASNELSDLLDPVNVVWRLAANLLAPIFDGGRRQAQVDVSTAAQEEAVANYADLALNAFSEVEGLLDQGKILRERRRALLTSDEASDRALYIAQLRFDEGENELIDVLNIQQRVFGTRSSLVAIQRSVLTHYIDLSLALGGDWRSPEEG
jgi:NodT family efflux transporter outer membrane factor (OMF) lipoprotein